MASECAVRYAAMPSSGGPAAAAATASWLLAPSRVNNRHVSAAICVAVFHLPQALTATAALAAGPMVAAHSRSADIVISRPMMTTSRRRRRLAVISKEPTKGTSSRLQAVVP
eukprot:GHRQ01028326.1.p1 GENE.GHRQ01028326.1~~GHRQ01028326.1.p1  ORF type:complete len:112 (-),score=11.25 GHRQ01028326.1:256-591(-)